MSSPVCYLDPVQLQRDLGMRDLSDPADGPHAIQILIGLAVEGLCSCLELRGSLVPRSPDRAGRRQLRPARIPGRGDHQGYPLHPVRGRRAHAAQSCQRHDPPGAAPARPPAWRRRAAGLPGDGVPPGRHRLAAHRDPAPARPVADHPAGDERHRPGPDDRGPPRRARPGPAPPPATADSSLHAARPPGRCVPRRPLGGGLGMRAGPSRRAGRRRAARPQRACPRHGPGPAAHAGQGHPRHPVAPLR